MRIIFTLLILMPTLANSLDETTLKKKFFNYSNDYSNLLEECMSTVSKNSITAVIDVENCVWDKDKILLYRYDFEDILMQSSYQRYLDLFNLSKATYLQENKDINGWANQKIRIEKDSVMLQWEILKKYYGF